MSYDDAQRSKSKSMADQEPSELQATRTGRAR
jgi:hypothetical protein